MSLFTTKVADLTILLGDQYSRIVQGEFETQDTLSLTIVAPAEMSGDIPFQIQVCAKGMAKSTDVFSNLIDDNDNPVLAPSAGKAKTFLYPSWGSWRIKAGQAVTVETTFQVAKVHC
jgi:predicted secreted protein